MQPHDQRAQHRVGKRKFHNVSICPSSTVSVDTQNQTECSTSAAYTVHHTSARGKDSHEPLLMCGPREALSLAGPI